MSSAPRCSRSPIPAHVVWQETPRRTSGSPPPGSSGRSRLCRRSRSRLFFPRTRQAVCLPTNSRPVQPPPTFPRACWARPRMSTSRFYLLIPPGDPPYCLVPELCVVRPLHEVATPVWGAVRGYGHYTPGAILTDGEEGVFILPDPAQQAAAVLCFPRPVVVHEDGRLAPVDPGGHRVTVVDVEDGRALWSFDTIVRKGQDLQRRHLRYRGPVPPAFPVVALEGEVTPAIDKAAAGLDVACDLLEAVRPHGHLVATLAGIGHEGVVADVAEYHNVVLAQSLGGFGEVRVRDVRRHTHHLDAVSLERGLQVSPRVPHLIHDRVDLRPFEPQHGDDRGVPRVQNLHALPPFFSISDSASSSAAPVTPTSSPSPGGTNFTISPRAGNARRLNSRSTGSV